MPMPVRRRNSSKRAVKSDDGGSSLVASASSLHCSIDDESLYVNLPNKSETIDDHVSSQPQTHPKGKSTGSMFRRGLSKSAVQLLSQDDQILSEILDVNVGSHEVNDSLEVNELEESIMNVNLTEERSRDLGLVGNVNSSENYIEQIGDLQKQLAEKEEEEKHQRILFQKQIKLQQQKEREYQDKINSLEDELKSLKQDTRDIDATEQIYPNIDQEIVENARQNILSPDSIARYSRQLLLSEGWGVEGQQKLLSSSVLVIGAGGIGSTVLLYLASSGIGNITVVDFDNVDMSNLHRQVIHTNCRVGMNKAESACLAMKKLNPTINCKAVTEMLTFENAMTLVQQHDCVVDACDNPQTRYLVNDACVLNQKPLVSGSAMGVEGQLTVYGYKNSACYRCLYPKVNPTEGAKSCSDNGVLGPVPGLIGILQAIETLKVLTETGNTMHDRLLMYDSLRCSFMCIKKGKRRSNCAVCSPDPRITNMEASKSVSSVARGPQQCGIIATSKIPQEWNRTCHEYYEVVKEGQKHLLLDVRVKRQYDLCSLKDSVNIDLGNLNNHLDEIKTLSENGALPIFCLCRRGIASMEATKMLREQLPCTAIYNVKGGLNAWKEEIDPSFPMY